MNDLTVAVLIIGVVLLVELIIFYIFYSRGYRVGREQNDVRLTETVLIDKGKILENALKTADFSLDELSAAARLSGYFNLADIDYAILETNGEISFLPTALHRPLIPKDFNFAPVREGLCTTVVLDGKIKKENIPKTGVSEEEIIRIIEQRGRKIENTLLATINEAGRVDVFEKQITL